MRFNCLQEEAKHQLEEMNRDRERERQSQEVQPSTSHDNFGSAQVNMSTKHNYLASYATITWTSIYLSLLFSEPINEW